MRKKLRKNSDISISDEGEGQNVRPPYSVFADIYDLMMEQVPYGSWAAYLKGRVREFLFMPPLKSLDLACGTGRLLEYLGNFAGEVYGLDRSQAMLEIAGERLPLAKFKKGVLEGPFPYASDTFSWIICTHDSLNYLISTESLQQHFNEVSRILRPDGLYSVDAIGFSNALKHDKEKRVLYKLPPYKVYWTGRYDRSASCLHTELEFHDKKGNIYVEKHLQRYFTGQEIRFAAENSGLRLLASEGNYLNRSLKAEDMIMNFHFQKR